MADLVRYRRSSSSIFFASRLCFVVAITLGFLGDHAARPLVAIFSVTAFALFGHAIFAKIEELRPDASARANRLADRVSSDAPSK
jgi:hypothetical protein